MLPSGHESRAVGLGADFLRSVDVTLAEIERNARALPAVHRGMPQGSAEAVSIRDLLRPFVRRDLCHCLYACRQASARVAGPSG